MQRAIAETAEASSKTIGFVVWRATQILAAREDAADIEVPSQRTLYRLFDTMAIGTHATGSATARRSVTARPAGPFGEVPACAPGEWMQIDSTPLDVLVRLDEGIAEKVELTGMVDLATRSLPAAVLRPTTKAADASALLARSVTPELMRPGWSEALRMSRSALPHRRLLGLDERLEHAAARPVIVPDTIVCDHGKVFISNNFRASCRYLGISLQPTHKASPFEKGTIEKTLGSVATLFSQFVAGYTGRSVDRRGGGLENGLLWSLPELQSLLDEWIVDGFTDRRSSDTDSELRRFIDYMSVTVSHYCLRSSVGVVRVSWQHRSNRRFPLELRSQDLPRRTRAPTTKGRGQLRLRWITSSVTGMRHRLLLQAP
ncbi:hypothetical protein [Streptomyces mirabilis]|uniref:hypothetical protein n=1 Tax=Streptomyces mirabilis TaxID=68239 RepID=UPI0036AF3DE1